MLGMKVEALAVGAAILGVTLLAACGGDNESSEATPTAEVVATVSPDEQDYLRRVSIAFRQSGPNFEKFRGILIQSFASADAFLGALKEAGAGTTFDPVLEAFERLDPPERFRADHDVALEGIRTEVAADRKVGQAAEEGDIGAFTVANTELGLIQARLALAVSAPFCQAVFTLDHPTSRFCAGDGDVPGGAYGKELHSIVKQFDAEFAPRVEALRDTADPELFGAVSYAALIAPEDYYNLFELIGPDLGNLLDETHDKIHDLDPSDEFRDDHNRLLQYFDEQVELFQEFSQAVEAQDRPERLRVIQQLGTVFCEAAGDFSSDFRPIVSIHFGGGLGSQCVAGAP